MQSKANETLKSTDAMELRRPSKIEDMVTTCKLISRIKQNGFTDSTITHAMLFVGDPGLGKTTLARIIADYLGANIDDNNFIEIDGTTKGIAAIKEIADIVSARRRDPIPPENLVVCIDEADSLISKDAISALLKIAEPGDADARAIKKRGHDPVYVILCANSIDPIKEIKNGALLSRLKVHRFSAPDSADVLATQLIQWSPKLKPEMAKKIVKYYNKFSVLHEDNLRGLSKTLDLYRQDPVAVENMTPPDLNESGEDDSVIGFLAKLLSLDPWAEILNSLTLAIRSNKVSGVRDQSMRLAHEFYVSAKTSRLKKELPGDKVKAAYKFSRIVMEELITPLYNPHDVAILLRVRRIYDRAKGEGKD